MAYWSLALLVVSISFLAYKNPEATRNALPPWLRHKIQNTLHADKQLKADEEDSATKKRDQAPSLQVSDSVDVQQDEATPKSAATQPKEAVPSFSLSNDRDESMQNQKDTVNRALHEQKPMGAPPTLITRSAPPVPSMLPPARQASSSLMPPPAPKPSTLMPPPGRPNPLPNRNPAPSLRVPTTGPLPNRGPPANSQQRAGSSNNGRGKILLSPGHSPMDWAALSRNSNLAGVPTLQRVTPSQLKSMTGRKGKPAWSSYMGKVYNITPYLPFHPGGEPELMKAAGRDGGKLFMEVHPWVNWEGMMGSCVVGILVGEHEGQSELDDMD